MIEIQFQFFDRTCSPDGAGTCYASIVQPVPAALWLELTWLFIAQTRSDTVFHFSTGVRSVAKLQQVAAAIQYKTTKHNRIKF